MNKTITIDGVEYTLTPKETKEETGRWVPKIGEEYWYIGTDYAHDEVQVLHNEFGNTSADKIRILTGNIYPTKKVAEKALAQKQALQRIYEYMDKEYLFFTPDWNDTTKKWMISGWDYNDDEPIHRWTNYGTDMSQHNFIFRTGEDMKMVLDNCAEDLEIVLKNY
jgi:hypothetical protein